MIKLPTGNRGFVYLDYQRLVPPAWQWKFWHYGRGNGFWSITLVLGPLLVLIGNARLEKR
jgi:hypothetical protein